MKLDRDRAAGFYRLLSLLGLVGFGISLLLGFGGSIRQFGTPPPIVLDPIGLASRYDAEGDVERAEHEYRMAGFVYPAGIDTTAQLTRIYERTGDREALVRMWKRKADMRPFDPAPRIELGHALLGVGRSDEGIELLELLSRRAPRYPGVHEALARGYSDLGRSEDAEAALREGLRHDPLSKGLHEELANVLRRLGRYQEAARELELASRLARSDSPAWNPLEAGIVEP